MPPTTLKPPLPSAPPVSPLPERAQSLAASSRLRSRGVAAELLQVWRDRRYLWFFCRRAVSFRYKRALFGWFWLLVRSLLWMLPFSFVVGHVAGGTTQGVPSGLFILVGLTLWTFLSNGVSFATLSQRYDRDVVNQLGISPILLVFANVGLVLIELAVSGVLLCGIGAAYYLFGDQGYLAMGPGTLLAVFYIGLAALFALGIGLVTAVLDQYAPDVRSLVPYLLTFWMLLTPVLYPSSSIPAPFRSLAWLNPMTGIVEGFRRAILGVGPLDGVALLWSAAAAVGVFVLGAVFFVRAQVAGAGRS
jgi:lipopolysaccharide transport system permease protein